MVGDYPNTGFFLPTGCGKMNKLWLIPISKIGSADAAAGLGSVHSTVPPYREAGEEVGVDN